MWLISMFRGKTELIQSHPATSTKTLMLHEDPSGNITGGLFQSQDPHFWISSVKPHSSTLYELTNMLNRYLETLLEETQSSVFTQTDSRKIKQEHEFQGGRGVFLPVLSLDFAKLLLYNLLHLLLRKSPLPFCKQWPVFDIINRNTVQSPIGFSVEIYSKVPDWPEQFMSGGKVAGRSDYYEE